jgi:hypothetical protein
MSLRNRFVLSASALLSLAFLTACGSSYNAPHPPPSGGFSNSSLNGTYVFSVVGSDAVGDFQAIAGTFTADGKGNIAASGTIDVNDPAVGPPATGVPITGGNYSVGSDGRGGYRSGGGLTLQTASATFVFDFVLSSSQGGLITEFDPNGTGSGTLDMQATVSQSNIDGQSYAFNLTGTSGVGPSICGVNFGTPVGMPLATVGAVTLDASGNVAAGVADFNNNCNSTGLTDLPITAGSVSLATAPGTATFTTSAGTFTFDVYPVTATHLKLIESDTSSIALAGDAFTQASPTFQSGASVFTLAGFDVTAVGPFTAAGIINTDGSATVTGGNEDINDVGNPAEVTTIGGSYTALTGGRSVLTLTGFNNGGNGTTGSYQFAVYPSSGGVQILEIDNAGMTGGIAYPQTATSIASSQGYGLNLSGSNANGEEDDIAEFTNNSGTLTGLIDYNDENASLGEQLSGDQTLSASYSPDTTVNSRGTITWGGGQYQLITYVVDNATAVFVETDPNQVGLGSLAEQNAGAMSNAAMRHLTVLGMKAGPKKAIKRH